MRKGWSVIEHSDGSILSVCTFTGTKRLKRARVLMRKLICEHEDSDDPDAEFENGMTMEEAIKAKSYTCGDYDIVITKGSVCEK